MTASAAMPRSPSSEGIRFIAMVEVRDIIKIESCKINRHVSRLFYKIMSNMLSNNVACSGNILRTRTQKLGEIEGS